VVQIDYRDSAVTGLRGGRLRPMDGHPRQWQSRHYLGGHAFRGGVLDSHLLATAKTDAGVRIRPRIDARALDLVAGREGEEVQSVGQRRARRRHEE